MGEQVWGWRSGSCLVDVVQFGTGSSTIVGFFSEPLGANFDPTSAGLTAARPVGPLAQLTVGRTGDDASLLDVTWNQSGQDTVTSAITSAISAGADWAGGASPTEKEQGDAPWLLQRDVSTIWLSWL